VFKDSGQNFSFDDVQKQKFEPYQKERISLAYSKDVYWFRFDIKNKSNPNNWSFLWGETRNDHVDIYIPQSDGKYKVLKGGILTKTSEKAYNGLMALYKVGIFPENSTQTFYVRIQSNWTINSDLKLVSQDTIIELMPTIFMFIWIVVGIHLLRVLYNVILAWYIRNIPFRWYTLHTVVVLIANLGSYGIIGAYFSDTPVFGSFLNDIFFQLMPASSALFFYSILKVKEYFPHLKWLFFTIIGLSIIQVPLFLVVPKLYLLMLHNYLFAFTVVFLIGMGIYTLFKRIPINAYLLIPVSFMLPPFFFLSLVMLGYMAGDWLFLLMYPSTLLEILSLSLVIGKVIETSNQEKLLAEKKFYAEKTETEKLLEINKLKTQFFTNISHEFRTPLTLILSPIDELKKKYPHEHVLNSMKRNAQRLLSLINQLLDLSKMDAGQMQINIQQNDMARFIQTIASSFSSLAEKRGIRFEIIQNRKEAIAYYDTDKIEKILTNLLSNAFKFTQNEGKITLSAKYTDDFKEVEIIVSDTGIGIDSQKIGHIFDRFFQADATEQRGYEGTGIGLALVKEMVEFHKGNIRVESTAGKGTTFIVKLPIDKTTWQAHIITVAEVSTNSSSDFSYLLSESEPFSTENVLLPQDEKILLVIEDNEDLRVYIRSIFEKEYTIIEGIDGQEGLEKALAFIPDIIVSDLMMPRMDGLELCRLLKDEERTSHIPIVMLTAKADVNNRIEGFDSGADDYLSKPFNKEELQARVKNLVTQRALLRQKFEKQIVDLKPTEVKVASIDERFINKAKEIIEKNIADNGFSIEYFAQEMAMTPVVLRRKIKALTNLTTTQFVRKYRLQKAAGMLESRADTVSNIAYKVGFENLSYFTRAFQEEFGQSPSEFGR
jgi:signal transduction histidine kinase/CheY-like chemotaxis protein/AraC-like DNA-binding protein